MNDTTTLADRVREILLTAGFNGTDGGICWVKFRIIAEGEWGTVCAEAADDVPAIVRRGMLTAYAGALRKAGLAVTDRGDRFYAIVRDPVADVRERVTAVLARHFEAGAFLVAAVTGGYAAVVTAGRQREPLAQYAATLREAGFRVADHWEQLYVRADGPEHDAAMAREIAGIGYHGYNEHVRLHGSPGADSPATMRFETPDGGGYTVERNGVLYDVTVKPRSLS